MSSSGGQGSSGGGGGTFHAQPPPPGQQPATAGAPGSGSSTSATSAQPQAQTSPSQTPPPGKGQEKLGWWKRWRKADTNPAVLLILCLIFWGLFFSIVIPTSYLYGPGIYRGAKTKAMTVAGKLKQGTGWAKSKAKAKYAPPAATPAVSVCRGYQVTKNPNAAKWQVSGCECQGDDCPKKIVCKDDQYQVIPEEEIFTAPDGTKTRFVTSHLIDVSNCDQTF